MAFPHDGFWQPMDTSRDHRYLNDLWTGGRAPWNTWDGAGDDEQAAELVLVGNGPAVGERVADEDLPRKSR